MVQTASSTHPLYIRLQDNPLKHPNPLLIWEESHWRVQFQAMASDCSILLEAPSLGIQCITEITKTAIIEVWRIEEKFSRYLQGNYYSELHSRPNSWQNIDEETHRLLIFCHQAWEMSDGLFDITSGVLRKVWKFDGSNKVPSLKDVNTLLPLIGWEKIQRRQKEGQYQLLIPTNMRLDFGGIGKEYAVDRALGLALHYVHKVVTLPDDQTPNDAVSLLVNLGGDIACSGLRHNKAPWRIAIESPAQKQSAQAILHVTQGGLATSGDAQRYLLKDGIRYSHVLNPKTGWPILNAPRSVTVAGPSCVQSGLAATLALLEGIHARSLLEQSGLAFWIIEAE